MPNVLLLEDDLLTAMLLQSLLEESGHSVSYATNTDDALNFIREKEIDIFLSDWGVEGTNSVDQVADELRQKNPASRLVFVSGYSEDEIAPKLEQLRPFKFYVKPVDFEKLVTSLGLEEPRPIAIET